MKKLGILIPTYKRPGKLQKVVDNLKEATHNSYTVYFCVEKDDKESYKAAKATGAKVFYNIYEPGCSNSVQTIYEKSKEPILFFANDDFFFLPEWDKLPIQTIESNDRMVVGVHDGNPNTNYNAVFFFRREYIEKQSGVVDMPNRVLYPYKHNYADTEFSQTAEARGVRAVCTAPCILHQHPSFTWLGDFPDDPTYQKNIGTFAEDSNTYSNRLHLW